ncbi:MAG: hypothetical protein P8K14_01760 [Flavobacteriaceae bacterium]|nr:hypothetical protein [Flavobacteriaceae bacterium]
MSTTKGTSNVPLIMGIIGAALGVPNIFCAGICGAGAGAMADLAAAGASAAEGAIDVEALDMASTAAAGTGSMWIAGGAALIGLIAGILGKSKPSISGIGMLVAMAMVGSTGILGNMLALLIAILYLIGGIIAFTQKKEAVS